MPLQLYLRTCIYKCTQIVALSMEISFAIVLTRKCPHACDLFLCYSVKQIPSMNVPISIVQIHIRTVHAHISTVYSHISTVHAHISTVYADISNVYPDISTVHTRIRTLATSTSAHSSPHKHLSNAAVKLLFSS